MLEKKIADLDKVLTLYIQELEKHIRVEKVILFGSYAHGTAHDYSDLDIAVFSPDFEGGTERDFLILGRAALKTCPLIEARPYLPEDSKNVSPTEFLAEILRTGKTIFKHAA